MIYIDLDGVLSDFDAGLAAHEVQNETSFIHLPKDQWTEEQKELDKQVVKCMSIPGFWARLPLTKDAYELYNYCKPFNPVILTARPNTESIGEAVKSEKLHWCQFYFGPQIEVIVCLRNEKKQYAKFHLENEQSILIDDLPVNCSEWESNGGTAILHTSAHDSIKQLKRILKIG